MDLCACLIDNCQILRDAASYITVYRGVKMSKSEGKRIQESIGHHIAVNGFFSSSRELSVAKIYAGIDIQNPSPSACELFEPVLFTVEVDMDTYPDIILADIPWGCVSGCRARADRRSRGRRRDDIRRVYCDAGPGQD